MSNVFFLYTGKICSHEFQMNLTWNSHDKFHVRFTLIELIHETYVKFFMWISRELKFTWIGCEINNKKKLISFMILIKFENLDVIWNTLFWKFMWISHEKKLLDFHVKFTKTDFTWVSRISWFEVKFTWDLHKFKFKWNWCEWNLPV